MSESHYSALSKDIELVRNSMEFHLGCCDSKIRFSTALCITVVSTYKNSYAKANVSVKTTTLFIRSQVDTASLSLFCSSDTGYVRHVLSKALCSQSIPGFLNHVCWYGS